MSDWSIQDKPRPYAFIQWKGTDVCADYYCVCGEQFHVDADFAYYVQCHYCQRRYEVSCIIELREMNTDEELHIGCKVDSEVRASEEVDG